MAGGKICRTGDGSRNVIPREILLIRLHYTGFSVSAIDTYNESKATGQLNPNNKRKK
jgi:hypothetical protein